jgi:hypothetical protein
VVINKYFKINIKDLFLIQFILEGYEGIVTVTTIDKIQGIIKVFFLSDFSYDIDELIRFLKMNFTIYDVTLTYQID